MPPTRVSRGVGVGSAWWTVWGNVGSVVTSGHPRCGALWGSLGPQVPLCGGGGVSLRVTHACFAWGQRGGVEEPCGHCGDIGTPPCMGQWGALWGCEGFMRGEGS